MTEEHKNLSVEERWMEWAQQTITIQKKELRELRRFKRESEMELRQLKKSNKRLRESLEKIKKKLENAPQSGLTIYHGADIYGECCYALEGKEE